VRGDLGDHLLDGHVGLDRRRVRHAHCEHMRHEVGVPQGDTVGQERTPISISGARWMGRAGLTTEKEKRREGYQS
jgi:hypothetical protein